MTDHAWIMIAGITSILSVLILISTGVFAPLWHRFQLRFPFRVFFVITSSDRYALKYAAQDYQEHQIRELTLPSNTNNIYVQLIFKPRLAFVQTNLVFGFDDTENRRTKPLVNKYQTNFIERGKREEAPETDGSDHYTDHHKLYHVPAARQRAAKQFVTCGFNIRTRKSGTYTAQLSMNADGVPVTRYLKVRVEDNPVTRMKYYSHSSCEIRPILLKAKKAKSKR